MPRLFTALEIPPEVANELAFLRGGLPGARWIDPENYHITLRFLGDVDDRTARSAAEILEGTGRTPIQITLEELDCFGGDRPRSIYAKVRSNPALLELQAAQERDLRRIGLAPEGRKYTPHVTLARLRDVSARTVADWLAQRATGRVLEFEASRFVLLSSRASVGGGPYVVEEVYPLGYFHEDEEDDHAEARW